jgi:spore maturation protein CgeB
MKLVIFGLTISSSWGNGHATLWRGLCHALGRRGHRVVFFERDVPYYAAHRDALEIPGCELVLYSGWDEIFSRAKNDLNDADVGMVTSYCPDAIAASELLIHSAVPLKTFYDLDTPVTLNALSSGKTVDYIGPHGFADFDLVLSYTGGIALAELESKLGARRVAPIYGSVDPEMHHPVAPKENFRCDLSYLGTYAEDRQNTLNELFIQPARKLSQKKFLIGGALYPENFPWTENVFFAQHVAPPEHPAFYCSSRITLNVTRRAMAEMGFCPSGRLFEAAACGTPILSDSWPGLERFFAPGREIIVARSTEDAIAAMQLSDEELKKISIAARERIFAEHTAEHRAAQLEKVLNDALHGSLAPGVKPGDYSDTESDIPGAIEPVEV